MSYFEGTPKTPRAMDDILQDISDLKEQIDLTPEEIEVKKERLLEEAKAARSVAIDIDKIIAEIPATEERLGQNDIKEDLSTMAEEQLLPADTFEGLLRNLPIDEVNYWKATYNAMERSNNLKLLSTLRKSLDLTKNKSEKIKALIVKKLNQRIEELSKDLTTEDEELLESFKKIDVYMDEGDGKLFGQDLDRIKNPGFL